jgi:hypothetical protein
MDIPPDLPYLIYYQLDFAVLTAFPRRPVVYVGSSGTTDAAQVNPQIPYGTRAWRLAITEPWRPLAELPKAWMPFLERKRPSEMDPRPAPGQPPANPKRPAPGQPPANPELLTEDSHAE